VLARGDLDFDFYLATKHWCVHYMHATLGLVPRVIAEQMGWTLTSVLKLLAVYGHGDVGALEEIDRAFERNVTPLRAVNSDAIGMQEDPMGLRSAESMQSARLAPGGCKVVTVQVPPCKSPSRCHASRCRGLNSISSAFP
jgi:hypothetical protein